MHSARKAQIEAEHETQDQNRAQVRALIFDKVPTVVLVEHSNYNNAFSAENITELPEYTGMNDHTIKLVEGKQLPFGPIYSLRPVALETLKTYIKTNLANNFIRSSKFSVEAPILFDRKPNKNLRLYVDYRDLNNMTIKNRYLLSLIDESLDQLGWAKQFMQLDLTNAYHQIRICENDKQKTAFKT